MRMVKLCRELLEELTPAERKAILTVILFLILGITVMIIRST
jgi:predicted nucleic acid-binding Zn ribbon protein